MSPGSGRRLRRGLSDISPIFRKKDPAAPLAVEQVPEKQTLQSSVLSVFSPDAPGDSFFLNTLIASQITREELPCSILSLTPEGETFQRELKHDLLHRADRGRPVKHEALSWERFQEACRRHVSRPQESGSGALFLDFDYQSVSDYERVALLLDKLILLSKPELGSLIETYKIIKKSRYYNKELEFFLIFEGPVNDQRGSLLFEKLSEMTSRHLGLQLLWLGHVDFAKGVHSLSRDLAVEYLFLNPVAKTGSPEKIALKAYVGGQPSLREAG